MKYFCLMIMFLISNYELFTEVKPLEDKANKCIKKNKIKEKDIIKYEFYVDGDSIWGFIEFNDFLYIDGVSKKCDDEIPFNLLVYNPKDSSIRTVSDICFYYVETCFTYKDNLYVVVNDKDEEKNSFATILCIKKDKPLVSLKHYTFKLQNATRLSRVNYKASVDKVFREYITEDKNGNLKLLISSFNSKLNICNLLFSWMPRGVGSIWEVDGESEEQTWYVFDEHLNLLYKEKNKN